MKLKFVVKSRVHNISWSHVFNNPYTWLSLQIKKFYCIFTRFEGSGLIGSKNKKCYFFAKSCGQDLDPSLSMRYVPPKTTIFKYRP